MVTILNRLLQPITVNIPNNKSIHFLAKETKFLTFDEFNSKEIQEKINNKLLVVLRLEN